MQQKKVIVVATGGTIAMKYDEASQGLIPACSGETLPPPSLASTSLLSSSSASFPTSPLLA